MKNKKLTYFLLPAALVLWGLILYRIFGAIHTGEDTPAPVAADRVKEKANDFSLPRDTGKLLLNYRDPFGITRPKDTIAFQAKAAPSKAVAATAKPVANWSFITYLGYIRNPASKKIVALVTINGQNVTLSEGETRSQVKLLKNLRDSIKISYGGKIKFIALKTKAS
jgi:hypothetical protein